MSKNRFIRAGTIIVLVVFIFSMNYESVFSKIIQKESNKQLISLNDIKWVKIVGGLNVNSKALFSGHDDKSIKKIVDMINKSEKLGKASNRDISYIYSEARPIGVLFKYNNDKKIIVWKMFEPNEGQTGAVVSREKVILDEKENGVENFYILKSNSLANFLLRGINNVMPLVKQMLVEKSSIGECAKEDDWIRVSGDGCTENKVCIYIGPNANPKLRYLVAEVTPAFGKWSWATILYRKMKTLDGHEFTIESGYYDVEAEMGQLRIGTSGVIKFDEN